VQKKARLQTEQSSRIDSRAPSPEFSISWWRHYQSKTPIHRNGLFLPVPRASSLDQMARHQMVEDTYLKELSRITAQNQDLGPHPTASNYAPTVIVGAVKGITKKELEAAQQRLLNAEKIHIAPVGPPSKQRKYYRPGPPMPPVPTT
jgi:hypothetical protein